MAERVAHQLGERLGDELGDHVAAHHGSLSRERRQRVEARLRAGDLRALVATASLELGIDIGPVELVCQIGSPRSFATFLQRVGRSNHTRTGTPSGRLYPTTRDELVECAALLRGVRGGRLDALVVPERPLDILAQQMVAECGRRAVGRGRAARPGPAGGAVRATCPPRTSTTSPTCSPRASAPAAAAAPHYLHRDQVNGTRQGPPRRPAGRADLGRGHPRAGRLPGAWPSRTTSRSAPSTRTGRWRAWPGDVFLLGTHSWRIRRVEPGMVRVTDAHGAPPSVPFWLGEAPGPHPGAVRGGLARSGRPVAGPGSADRRPAALARGRVRHRRGRGRDHRGLPARRAGRARGAADHGHHHPGAVLRRGRRHAAGRARAVRRPAEPGARAGPAQAVLRHVRLRAAGGGQRRRDPAVARAAAQLPAGAGAEVPGLEDRGAGGPAGRADRAAVRRRAGGGT